MPGWLGKTLSEQQSLLGVAPGYADIAQMFGLCALAADLEKVWESIQDL